MAARARLPTLGFAVPRFPLPSAHGMTYAFYVKAVIERHCGCDGPWIETPSTAKRS
jgi:hypothetical protein